MNFQENFKRPLTPPPHFRRIILQFFLETVRKRPYIKAIATSRQGKGWKCHKLSKNYLTSLDLCKNFFWFIPALLQNAKSPIMHWYHLHSDMNALPTSFALLVLEHKYLEAYYCCWSPVTCGQTWKFLTRARSEYSIVVIQTQQFICIAVQLLGNQTCKKRKTLDRI